MEILTLIEIIFTGKTDGADLGFLEEVVSNAEEMRFNDPDDGDVSSYGSILDTIAESEYVDLVIVARDMKFGEALVKKRSSTLVLMAMFSIC